MLMTMLMRGMMATSGSRETSCLQGHGLGLGFFIDVRCSILNVAFGLQFGAGVEGVPMQSSAKIYSKA